MYNYEAELHRVRQREFLRFKATAKGHKDLRYCGEECIELEYCDEMQPVRGNIYADCLTISISNESHGKWMLHLGKQYHVTEDLDFLERMLFLFAVDEGYFEADIPPPFDQHDFEAFQATGVAYLDLRLAPDQAVREFHDRAGEPCSGRLYNGYLFIDQLEDGRWALTIGNIQQVHTDLVVLERALYAHAIEEGDWVGG